MYVDEFSYTPAQKNLDTAEEITEGAAFTDSILAFIQVEGSDEEHDVKAAKKLVNHLKWTPENDCKNIICIRSLICRSQRHRQNLQGDFDLAEIRLQNGGYTTAQTPFGYFLT